MNTPNCVMVRYEPLRSLDWTLVALTYMPVGTALINPVRIIKVSNSTDIDLLVSFNGVDDHDFLGSNSYSLYDYGSNRSDMGGYLDLPSGERFFVKSADGVSLPSTGKVYVTVFYVSGV